MPGYRRVDANLDLIKWKDSFAVRLETLIDGKSCRHAEGGRFSLATALKFVYIQLTSDFGDACPEPAAKTSILIEESNLPPFAAVADQFGTRNGLCRFKHLLQICMPEMTKNPSNLPDEFRIAVRLF